MCTMVSLHSMRDLGFQEFYSNTADIVSSSLMWFFLSFSLVYPIISAIMLIIKLKDPEIYSKQGHLGALLMTNHHRTLSSALFEVVHCLRRLVIMVIIVFIPDYPWLQA